MIAAPQEQLFTRSRSVVSRVVAGETLIVPVRGKVGDLASIYSFNATGSLIWQLLDSPRSLSDLIDAVERTYQVEPEQAQQDVTQFLNDMRSAGLLDACPASAMIAAALLERSCQGDSCQGDSYQGTTSVLEPALSEAEGACPERSRRVPLPAHEQPRL